MMERRSLTHERAVNAVEFSDRDRGKYYKHCTNKKWGVPESYDVTLNVTALGIEGTVEYLTALFQAE